MGGRLPLVMMLQMLCMNSAAGTPTGKERMQSWQDCSTAPGEYSPCAIKQGHILHHKSTTCLAPAGQTKIIIHPSLAACTCPPSQSGIPQNHMSMLQQTVRVVFACVLRTAGCSPPADTLVAAASRRSATHLVLEQLVEGLLDLQCVSPAPPLARQVMRMSNHLQPGAVVSNAYEPLPAARSMWQVMRVSHCLQPEACGKSCV